MKIFEKIIFYWHIYEKHMGCDCLLPLCSLDLPRPLPTLPLRLSDTSSLLYLLSPAAVSSLRQVSISLSSIFLSHSLPQLSPLSGKSLFLSLLFFYRTGSMCTGLFVWATVFRFDTFCFIFLYPSLLFLRFQKRPLVRVSNFSTFVCSNVTPLVT
jgi:hypothetical protein